MIVPVIHLNGTSKNALVEQYADCFVAVGQAISVLQKNGPNARDYYLKGPDAYQQADQEHEARIQKLREVKAELEQLVEQIDSQGKR